MFLALRELRHARLRYLLVSAIIVLLAWLVFLLSGLANGLATDNGAALQNMNADYLALQAGSRLYLHQSTLAGETVAQVRDAPGVRAVAPLGQLTATVARADSTQQIDVTILAIEPDSFLAPTITDGQPLAGAPEQSVVVNDSLARHGVKLGDQLQVTSTGQTLTVVGFTRGQTFNHLPVVFMDIPLWRSIKFAGGGANSDLADPISAVAIQATETTPEAIAAVVPGVDVASRITVMKNLPGYAEEMATITMMLVFLFIIAAFVLAVFFYVLTLQKTNQFGVLKALGASTGFLARNLVAQVLSLTAFGVVVGAALAYLVAALMPANIPFALQAPLVGTYGLVLLGVALLGTLLSLRRIATIDPLVAIGRMD